MADSFPIDLSKYQKVPIDPFTKATLSAEDKAAIKANIQLCRDAIVFFTACGAANGHGGHTGGAFDTVPEVVLLDSFFQARPDKFVPILFDEAGHRVATQYLFSALKGKIPAAHLKNYRVGHAHLPGHPELGCTPGVEFSSGRLGHMWPMVNGWCFANPDKISICLGSDGSQQEGNDAEAARLAVARKLNVKLVIDDNNVTIAGHPEDYLKGYDVVKTLEGHGVKCVAVDGEDVDALYAGLRAAMTTEGPFAVVAKRKMCPGVKGVEGECHGHDVIALAKAVDYLTERNFTEAVAWLNGPAKKAAKDPQAEYLGTKGSPYNSNRNTFGDAVCKVLAKLPEADRKKRVMVIDSDLEGSTGLKVIHQKYPDVFVQSGIMERGNFSAAAGFGMAPDRQGVFSTFSAFQEMVLSEVTMARLNRCNVLCHFSHSGCDDMADNTCHFGINNMFADNGVDEYQGIPSQKTSLYFPADSLQLEKVVESVFWDQGMRFVYTTRSKVPLIQKEDGSQFFGEGYSFVPGKDDLIREGKVGYIVSFGDALYRSLDAVERLRKEGFDFGLVNKCTLNEVDEEMMQKIGKSGVVLVVEPFNTRSGVGMRFGTWLLERGLTPKYGYVGVSKEGSGGLWEHAYHQGYDSASIQAKAKALCMQMLLAKAAK